jgi:hypothetical protein
MRTTRVPRACETGLARTSDIVHPPAKVSDKEVRHFTPKHASWLNMDEIRVMVRQCLDRRIADMSTLIAEVAKWQQRRNREQAPIEWLFTVDRAARSSAVPIPFRPPGRAASSSCRMNQSDPL